MKLSIGTAQFGFNYGICNNSGIIKKKEAIKILEFCKQKKINSIDTAQGYAKSHSVLGSMNLKKFKITTKILIEKKIGNKDLESYVFTQINKILKQLNTKNIYAVLIHNPNELKNKFGRQFYEVLKKLKKRKKVNRIGVSVCKAAGLHLLYLCLMSSRYGLLEQHIDTHQKKQHLQKVCRLIFSFRH